MMNKLFKKISAVAIATAMTFSTGVAANAATMKVYLREWKQNNVSDTYTGTPVYTFGTEPVVVVKNVQKGTTYKAALNAGVSDTFKLGWNPNNSQYLDSITLVDEEGEKAVWKNNGKNTNPDYNGSTMVGATWVGSSWMWYSGDNIALTNTSTYPTTTLGETLVPVQKENSDDEVFSVVLSYDTTQFNWGTRE